MQNSCVLLVTKVHTHTYTHGLIWFPYQRAQYAVQRGRNKSQRQTLVCVCRLRTNGRKARGTWTCKSLARRPRHPPANFQPGHVTALCRGPAQPSQFVQVDQAAGEEIRFPVRGCLRALADFPHNIMSRPISYLQHQAGRGAFGGNATTRQVRHPNLVQLAWDGSSP